MRELEIENLQLRELLSGALELLNDCRSSHGLFVNQEYWKLKEKIEQLNLKTKNDGK